MAADDLVDTEAMIFTEADVYMICGYLAEHWGLDDGSVTEDTEAAITAVLSNRKETPMTYADHPDWEPAAKLLPGVLDIEGAIREIVEANPGDTAGVAPTLASHLHSFLVQWVTVQLEDTA